ncbi:MAG: YdcF family protein, partial [Bdellovibrionales bacterium]|nr:YdcF family protein [Bdellovibrionales bacterium]
MKVHHLRPLAFLLAAMVAVIYLVNLVRKEAQHIEAVPVHSWIMDQRADCGLVLTGGPGRLREGFDLLVQKNIKKLIISGVHPDAGL